MLTQIDVQVATNQSLGIVKGSNTNGKVFIETDGSMSLKGYDTLVSKDATHDSKISTLETGLGNANARIDATNTNVANNATAITVANGNISTNTNDISGLKDRMATAEGQIATHETKINQHTQSINGLTTDVNGLKTDVNGLKGKMTTAEGQIATHETEINQHTQSINGLTTDVNGLKTDVNGLKTSKQDKLTAGVGIKIVNNVISATPASWKKCNLSDIYTFSNDILTIKPYKATYFYNTMIREVQSLETCRYRTSGDFSFDLAIAEYNGAQTLINLYNYQGTVTPKVMMNGNDITNNVYGEEILQYGNTYKYAVYKLE